MDVTEKLIDRNGIDGLEVVAVPPPDASSAPSVREQSAHEPAHDPENPQRPTRAELVEIQADVRVRHRRVWKTIAEAPSRRLTLHVRAGTELRSYDFSARVPTRRCRPGGSSGLPDTRTGRGCGVACTNRG
jgi:hypothetical protein